MSNKPEGMRSKDKRKLADKIEEAINILSLEHYLEIPDYIIAEMLVDHLEAVVKAKQSFDIRKDRIADMLNDVIEVEE